jgi:hypothetical protein
MKKLEEPFKIETLRKKEDFLRAKPLTIKDKQKIPDVSQEAIT